MTEIVIAMEIQIMGITRKSPKQYSKNLFYKNLHNKNNPKIKINCRSYKHPNRKNAKNANRKNAKEIKIKVILIFSCAVLHSWSNEEIL